MSSRLSLANKCLLIFGCAIIIIIASILTVVWSRSLSLIQVYQLEVSQQLADLWMRSQVISDGFQDEDVSIKLIRLDSLPAGDESFPERARNAFVVNNNVFEKHFYETGNIDGQNYFMFAQPITHSQFTQIRQQGITEFGSGVSDPSLSDPVEAVLVVWRKTEFAEIQISRSKNLIFTAGILGSLLAALIFFVILKRLILSPVRKLRRIAERVRQGDLTARASLQTGDEFEELSNAFNAMLNQMESDQLKLQTMNDSLDLKVEELAEVNIGLFESSKLKNEFIANVSHELRTPLNSIIGFAELLEGMNVETKEQKSKRLRYLQNIVSSGRSLLDMINELLDMAKIEAGRMEVNLEPTSIVDLLEGLAGIMRPQAKAKKVTIQLDVESNLPIVQTDPGKLQQILYNYLSNAIKFTPNSLKVILEAKLIHSDAASPMIRIAVIDAGPGIPEDMLDMVFEKFRQVDATHTREHAGTGLGLAICKELAELLHAHLFVQSTISKGASFFVDVPVTFAPETPEPLMPS